MPKIQNLRINADNVDAVKGGIRGAMQRALERIGMHAEGYAKDLCPVDTGNLRNSITHITDDKAAYIGTNVEYGKYVETGTVKNGGTARFWVQRRPSIRRPIRTS